MKNLRSRYAETAARYIEGGYSPIPIMPGSKRPGLQYRGEDRGLGRWQRFCDTPADARQIEAWSDEHTVAGVGIALGGANNVVAIDIDVAPGPVYDALVDILPTSEWAKEGSKGFTAFFRTDEPMKAQKFSLRMGDDGQPAKEDSDIRPMPVLEILSHGNQTVIPPTVHPASLRVALAGGAVWSSATASPIDDLEDMAVRVRLASKGAVCDTVVMHTTAWQLIRKHPDFKDRLNKDFADGRINKTSIDDGIQTDPIGLNYVGRLDSKLSLFVYDDYLTDDNGEDVALMDDYTVVVMSRGSLSGATYHGAILDSSAQFASMVMHAKSRSSWDPAGEELLSQSAPLVAPARANTWGTINVN